MIVDQLGELFASSAPTQDRFVESLERLAESGTLVPARLRADF